MPIVIKDFSWEENENIILLTVPMQGLCNSSKYDIMCTKGYIKVIFHQTFFEVFLLHPIQQMNSVCTLTSNKIVFELEKITPQLWRTLEPVLTKAEKHDLRKKYIDEYHFDVQENARLQREGCANLNRFSVREQITLDAESRLKLEAIKQQEKANAIRQFTTIPFRKTSNICEVIRRRSIIGVRHKSIVTVSFTPREFPTPSRESLHNDEMEWLRKQAEAQRATGFRNDDLRPEERNPMFLLMKGMDFAKKGNFLAAISAYTYGLQISDTYLALYMERAKAQRALGNYGRVVEDCSAALNLLKPELEINAKERAWCIGLRGIGLLKLGLQRQGIDELKASLKIMPENEEFRQFVQQYI